MDFLKGARDLARNPLGIIALFISLIYGFATLLLSSAAQQLTEPERWPLIVFIVLFPVVVLGAFYRLVTKHHGKLYAPGDFKEDRSFLRTLSPEEQDEKLEKDVQESVPYVTRENQRGQVALTPAQADFAEFKRDMQTVESAVISIYEKKLGAKAEHNVGVGDSDAKFDAMFVTDDQFIALEAKALKAPILATPILDRLLYQAVIADKYLEGQFKLIIVVVYYFADSDVTSIQRRWKQQASKCPARVEVEFISRASLPNVQQGAPGDGVVDPK